MTESDDVSSTDVFPPAESAVTVRPLRFADLDGVNAGDEYLGLYRMRSHAGLASLDRSEVIGTTSAPVPLLGGNARGRASGAAGVKRSVSVSTVYGSEVTVHLYDSPEALDADVSSNHGVSNTVQRQRAAAQQADPGVYIEDPDGDMTLPLTPDWGSQVHLFMLAPDIEPGALVVVITDLLNERFPGHRLVKVQSRSVANRRVDVVRPRPEVGETDHGSRAVYVPIASNLLEAEAVAYGPPFRLEQVGPTNG